jgi:hypothetical protein
MSRRRITTTAALTFALAASAPAAASATPHAPTTGPCSEVCSGNGYERTAATPDSPALCSEACSGDGYATAPAPTTVVRIVAATSGFHWGDAGIGAGAALGIVLVGTGGTLLLMRRRTDSHAQTAR